MTWSCQIWGCLHDDQIRVPYRTSRHWDNLLFVYLYRIPTYWGRWMTWCKVQFHIMVHYISQASTYNTLTNREVSSVNSIAKSIQCRYVYRTAIERTYLKHLYHSVIEDPNVNVPLQYKWRSKWLRYPFCGTENFTHLPTDFSLGWMAEPIQNKTFLKNIHIVKKLFHFDLWALPQPISIDIDLVPCNTPSFQSIVRRCICRLLDHLKQLWAPAKLVFYWYPCLSKAILVTILIQ